MKFGDKLIPLIVGSIGVLIFILDLLAIVENYSWLQHRVAGLTLVSISTLMLYLLFESKSKEEKITGLYLEAEKNKTHIIESLNGISLKAFKDSDEAFEYLTVAIINAKRSIDQVAIAPTPNIHANALSGYLSAMKDVAKNGSVKYRYIFGENYPERKRRITELALDQSNRKFVAKYFDAAKSNSLPILNFVIFDSLEVFMRYPNTPGQKEIYISATQPNIKELFEAYYERLWEQATTL